MGIQYESRLTPGGYVTTVQCPLLPDPYGPQRYLGEVCAKRKDAEVSAAGAALGALFSDAKLLTMIKFPKPAPWQAKGAAKGSMLMQRRMMTNESEKMWLQVCVDGGPTVRRIEISRGTNFASVRVLLNQGPTRDLPDNFLFQLNGNTVTKSEEG